MYDDIEKKMRRAARNGSIVLGTHVRQNLTLRRFTASDIESCFETGNIVQHQYDGDEVKYIWHGDSLDGREIGLVTKLTYHQKVFVLTVYWVEWLDYD
jgi:Domain of unknown function (DUF4258)